MGKAYLRYEPAACFGVIASHDANICFDSGGKHVLAPALDSVNVWNLRQSTCTKVLSPTTSHPSVAVTSIASSPSSSRIASGHANGTIRIWDGEKGTCETVLKGHRGAVTALRFDKKGSLLASGSKDCCVSLWDMVAMTGLFSLMGHRDQVTDVAFVEDGKILASCSKDKYLRVWDVSSQHCIQIITDHSSEIWSVDVDAEERYLVTGSADPELRVYSIEHESPENQLPDEEGKSESNKYQVLKHFGDIRRQNKDSKSRVATVRFNRSGNLFGCQEAGKTIDLYKVLEEKESKRKAKKRLSRKKEKKLSKKGDDDPPVDLIQMQCAPTVVVADVFIYLQSLRTSKKISSFSFSPLSPTKSAIASLVVSLNNNQLELHVVQNEESISKSLTIDLQGHRSDVRSVALSSDNTLLMSTSHNAVKIWNPSTGASLRTIESGYGLCGTFVPGNRYAAIGTKNGKVEIMDVGSGTCIETIEAHADSVSSIVLIPDGSGFVTGSIDHDVKFWEYQCEDKTLKGSNFLTVANVKTLKMDNEVTTLAISPDAKYIAIALLDYTIKVFNMGRLDNPRSLFGHKLPVLGVDISSDGELIVSGSADKNLKIWGLKFGDCHKSIFAHADSVMAVQFVRNTHYVFSVGKDRLVKYWDADKFELVLTLEGHHSYVWCLAVSNRGDFLVTGSNDRSIRRWDRTDVPLFIEDERENRLEEMFENADDDLVESKYTPKIEAPEEGAVGFAGKKTQETLTATDEIIDALDLAKQESERIKQHEEDERKSGRKKPFQPNIVMNYLYPGISPSNYVLEKVSNVPPNDLDEALLALPFSDALRLLEYLKDWASYPDKVEPVCRIGTILLQTHHNQLTATPEARSILSIGRDIIHQRVKKSKDTIGFNLAAMDHLKQLMSQRSDAPFRDAKRKLMEMRAWHSKRLEEKTEIVKERKKRKKRKV